jgi:hypothetical protein
MNRFNPPTDSDNIVQCADCGFRDNHENMHWDDDDLAYRCQEHFEIRAQQKKERE